MIWLIRHGINELLSSFNDFVTTHHVVIIFEPLVNA